jgi:hypothetical protein
MIRDVPKPVLSPQFTLDDIHKIQEWNYERLKDATPEERLDDINKRGARALKRFEAWKAFKHTGAP